jgi:hypothetical protein
MSRSLWITTLAIVVGLSGSTWAAEPVVIDPKTDESLAEELTPLLVKSAHPTGAKPTFKKQSATNVSGGRIVWTIRVEYQGALSGNRYEAEAVIKLTGKPGDFDVTDIEFRDLNNKAFAANEKNLQALRRDLAQKINKAK